MKTIVALGTLREDITLNYDFSLPMNVSEVKINKAEWSVGGSVHNTCYYLSLKNPDLSVRMCSANYKLLVQRISQDMVTNNYRIITTKSKLYEYPISIIGVHEDGDKQILSYDPIVDTEVLFLFEHEACNADFIYTSFYEVNKNNYHKICEIFRKCHARGGMTMVDLCPLIGSANESIVREILSNTMLISGNEYEYKELMHKLDVVDTNGILEKYSNIKYMFVKRGNQGAEYNTIDGGEKCNIHCEQDDSSTMNTTGCGDVFNAVIIDGICKGEDSRSILKRAVIESGEIAKGGLPWIKK